eukprot:TRINITY_DN2234_c0_g1_i10.p1 TRINITY_DN2234_c0_g1~~TRINITY_DN2234_c0_g1_i10.p1  ORF type:complete len:104 (+),score=1.49 TRINITY_DN2234_c0_g1_i10:160-471(+)
MNGVTSTALLSEWLSLLGPLAFICLAVVALLLVVVLLLLFFFFSFFSFVLLLLATSDGCIHIHHLFSLGACSRIYLSMEARQSRDSLQITDIPQSAECLMSYG